MEREREREREREMVCVEVECVRKCKRGEEEEFVEEKDLKRS